MMTRRAKTVVIVTVIAGVAVLVGFGMLVPSAILEPWYLEQLESDLTEDRERAVQRLQELGSTKLIPRLIELPAKDPDKLVFASQTLARIGDPAVPYLRAALKSEHQMIRQCGARGLDDRDKIRLEALVEALEHDDPQVKIHALSVLARNGARKVVPALLGVLNDENAGVRRSAVQALSKGAFGNGAPVAIPPR